jgi:hypothetical protein
MRRRGKKLTKNPLAVIPPPIITPRYMTVGFMITVAPINAAAQIIVPVIQRPVPTMIFNSDPR